ncbi:MAG: signal peptidase I [Salinispira sp.]
MAGYSRGRSSVRSRLRRNPRTIRWIWSILLSFFLILEITGSLFMYFVRVSSRSMAPNYQVSERMLIGSFNFGMVFPFTDLVLRKPQNAQRGQVILFKPPYSAGEHMPVLHDIWAFFAPNRPLPWMPGNGEFTHEGLIMRRIIALPGDRVYLNGGIAYVQTQGRGEFVSEHSIGSESYELLLPRDEFDDPDLLNHYYSNTFVVPENEIFVLPDNRLEAFGSVSWGGILLSAVRGRVLRKY